MTMKTKINTGRLIICLISLATMPIFAGCDKDDDDKKPEKYIVYGDASGTQETPPITSSQAMGTISGTYDADSNMFRYTIYWTGLTGDVTGAHFHGPADRGESAGPLINISLATDEATGTTSGSIALPDSTERFLIDGKLYYNLHTAMHTEGEIRGQLSTIRF